MNFGGAKPDSPGPKDPDLLPRQSAAPPPCPRCELVKSQCTKTIINYQKSHRKKIEALRTELKSARQQVDSLQRQLHGYKNAARIVPVVVALAGATWIILLKRLRRSKSPAASPPPPHPPAGPEEQQEQLPVAPVADLAQADPATDV
ncbi:hypothetical protein VOLCADRAFT_121150 [Volvox carteri f. nagariensis]|uniref:Uncharacterized protein n=1 Tax=Volvox carteri f. nagariensis TaxID=3068 RepID=D8U3K9_VOLCA|nr:uncharacterized protein VOLCADRAFT_121150 [Volvox carteri f. nagariensis]EFJ45549.1 hypothetical protein VOLCADRAFT_121150 [Volvox carteri f. nagariensis]|eukprot:XP_002953239.1 hypothetical protein VOLCADRAFT_121150 [Volvox carteri f. nagariensis]